MLLQSVLKEFFAHEKKMRGEQRKSQMEKCWNIIIITSREIWILLLNNNRKKAAEAAAAAFVFTFSFSFPCTAERADG